MRASAIGVSFPAVGSSGGRAGGGDATLRRPGRARLRGGDSWNVSSVTFPHRAALYTAGERWTVAGAVDVAALRESWLVRGLPEAEVGQLAGLMRRRGHRRGGAGLRQGGPGGSPPLVVKGP